MPATPSRSNAFTPAPSSGDTGIMPDLYRLSVGAVNAAYYQRHFQRFETLGKAVPTWNHGAAFCTLAWLVLRKLWRPAALYLCLLAALLLVWWGGVHGRLPLPLELALCLLVGMLLCVVPGTLGNALYYQHVRQHTLQTLTRASSLSQARAQLAEQAVTKDRLHTIAAIQALLLAALTGLVLHQVKQGGPSEAPAPSGPPDLVIPQVSSLAPTQPVAFTPTPAAVPPADTAPAAPALSLVTLAQAVPATPEAAPKTALVAEPAPAIAPAPAPAAAPAAVPEPAPALAAASPPAAPPPAPAKKAVTPPAPAVKAPAPAKPDKSEKTDKGSKTAKAEKADKADKASKSAPEPKPAPAAANVHLVPGKFYLNAGVYAQAANVDKAVQQLQGAKLNALRQSVSSSKGDLTRLRIGPFDTRQQAEQAAAKAKQLRIDASVFQHPRG
ncbi:SPOR domain-containing protein [Comamonas aquatica]|uniref:SPOR domain-containing protein n=1 Tax=Comamonas aquatica TaxID=225991 RepID=UPI00244ADFD3|nr:SPOR domain-containing protein [Comamonas aquatica]MDH0494856.1 SPOR domain-containing protein [Comamonas aquatica]